MDNETALLVNAGKYGLDGVPCGIVEPSTTLDPKKRRFFIGDGRFVEVFVRDLISIDLLDGEKRKLFPLCF